MQNMRIVLCPGPHGTLGNLDGRPLAYHGGKYLLAGEPIEHRVIANALVDAVDEAARRVFGNVWVKKLGQVAGLNLRRCQRDRIAQFGLPPTILEMLGRAAAHRDARALGDMMLAVARLRESHLSGHTLIEDAEHALSLAIELVADVRPSR